MTTLRDELLRFINELRGAGVRISIAESLDAMNAIAIGGLERSPMREALAATLIKEESDRHIFDELFAVFFRGARNPIDDGWRKPGSEISIAPGSRRIESESIQSNRKDKESKPSPLDKTSSEEKPEAESDESADSERDQNEGEKRRGDRSEEKSSEARSSPDLAVSDGQDALRRTIERTPFEGYSDLEFEQARDALAPIERRFRVRLGRRLRIAKTGALDFRRTIRASIQRGGALSDLRFRARRPRHIDVVILADISGSVRYSSTLMLDLIAGASDFFRRVRSFVFIDRMAEAEFEQRHLIMTPALDLYARSDFGRVLGELWGRRAELLSRATVLVIMGDGRNNRRPARADLLREMARLCRAVIWLIPEERERWGTGDSAILQYQHEVSELVAARNLRELESGLLKLA